MISPLLALLALALPIGLARGDAKLSSASTASTEIRVTLFGQPCLLSGPLDEGTLRTIHAISPEKTPAPETADQARQLLERLRKLPAGVPSALDRYREKLGKRVAAQLAYFEGLAGARKNGGKADALLAATREHLIGGKRAKEFEELARKTDLGGAAGEEALSLAYSEAIEPSPEEEFHRAIQRLNVRYTCSFEEGESD
jgi:hypothetical protein